MIDWTKSMIQTFEYYKVDPDSWHDTEKLTKILTCTIDRDGESDTLGSGSIECVDNLNECYIRVYMVAIQNGYTYKVPIGTLLVQAPSSAFDGKLMKYNANAYTPLMELKEKGPILGYSLTKGLNILDTAAKLFEENMRAPVVGGSSDDTLINNFVASPSDTWLTYLKDLVGSVNYEMAIDEMGTLIFEPYKELSSLQPVWVFTDDNSSILYPDITYDRDIYSIPNVVEVTYSTDLYTFTSVVENDNPNSPVSIQNRGRRIVHRVSNPSYYNITLQTQLDTYAKKLLRELSSLECKISYSHGYCPVRIGDCVELNYKAAGLNRVKAKVITQSIKCEPGCPVTETAVFTSNLWG